MPNELEIVGVLKSFWDGIHCVCLESSFAMYREYKRKGKEMSLLPSGLSHVSGKIPEETASGMRAEFWYMLSTCHDGEGVALGTESILHSAARTQFRPCKLLKLMLGNNRV